MLAVGPELSQSLLGLSEALELALPHERVDRLAARIGPKPPASGQARAAALEPRELTLEAQELLLARRPEPLYEAENVGHFSTCDWLLFDRCDCFRVQLYTCGRPIAKRDAVSGDFSALREQVFHANVALPGAASLALKAAVMVESIAQTLWLARQLGPLQPLPNDEIRKCWDRYHSTYGQRA